MQFALNPTNLLVNRYSINILHQVWNLNLRSLDLSSVLDKGDLVRMGLDQTGASLMRTMWCSGWY